MTSPLFLNAFSEIFICLSCSLGEARGITSVCSRCHHWVENQFWCFKVGVKQWVSIATFFVPSLLDTWVLRLDLTFKFQNLLIVSINLWRFYVQPSWMTLCDSFSRPHLGDNAFCCINCVAMNCLCIWLLAFLSVIIIWLFRSYNPI